MPYPARSPTLDMCKKLFLWQVAEVLKNSCPWSSMSLQRFLCAFCFCFCLGGMNLKPVGFWRMERSNKRRTLDEWKGMDRFELFNKVAQSNGDF